MPAAPPLPTRREDLLARLAEPRTHDLAIVGGGATGLGVALDAAARGFDVVLLEAEDFAKGTSSRATKLVHGGVRYLAQGNVALVREALRERDRLLHNAPHLAGPLPFVMPAYRRWEAPFYGLGLKLYDLLAGRAGLGDTALLGREATLRRLPNLRAAGLRAGVLYWDGQFDDARLAIALARSAAERGALLVNHLRVTGLLHEGGRVAGVVGHDAESGRDHPVRARCVVNATGVWVDALRALDGAGAGGAAVAPMVAPSQGVHLVVDRSFLPTDHALLVPSTSDGRVLFAVPWLGSTLLGTTDTPRADLPLEPEALADEVSFILRESARYLARAPGRDDVRSAWVGLRPLVRPPADDGSDTKRLSREHTVLTSRSGLVTVTGGKWTTYRAIAEDVLDACFAASLLERRAGGVTERLVLAGGHGAGPARGEGAGADARTDAGSPGTAPAPRVPLSAPPGLHLYGSDARFVQALPGAGRTVADGLTEAMVRFAARHEYARTVEDVLARRSRLLFLDARRAAAAAPAVAALLREETGADPRLEDFLALARRYASLPGAQD
jgi:glycerol-3-phosphate dehydrogenase